MKTIINLFHPDFSNSRANKALVQNVNDEFEVRDLYALYPDFKIDVEKEKEVLEKADRIVLEFPIRWYSSPALLKQWEDDVLEFGWAYGPNGDKLHGKELLIAATFGANNYGRDGFAKYEPHELLRPFQATSRLIGTTFVKQFTVTGATSIADADLAQAAKDYRAYLEQDSIPALGYFE